ncbi:MAG: sugar transferase [Bacteroidetes bacterium]|nr:MAG: sugar transferase [Bacteroidota bacterium]
MLNQALYIGNNLGTVRNLRLLFELRVTSKVRLINPTITEEQIIFLDIDERGQNSLENIQLLNKILPNETIKIAITSEKLDSKYIDLLKLSGATDIFSRYADPTAISTRIKYLLSPNGQEDDFHSKVNFKPLQRKLVAKRLFDLFFSSLALGLLSPIFLLIALAIRLDSKGPIFYVSRRVGKAYQVFDFYKFRTMKPSADQEVDLYKDKNQYGETKANQTECVECRDLGHPCSPILIIDQKSVCENHYHKVKRTTSSFFKLEHDPRVTRLGHFLRKSSLDELPQLINIFRGDMSFVGNRPLPEYEAELLTSDDFAIRFHAPAGLTGLWQVRKRGKKEMSEQERKSLDNSYARNCSLRGDLLLILKTIPILFQKADV